MLDKLKAFYAVFTAGQQVADPVKWKKRQVTSGMLAAFLCAAVALAKTFGYTLPLDDDQLLQISGALLSVLGVFNGAVTVASTTKIGLPAAEPVVEFVDEPADEPVAAPVPAVAARSPGVVHRVVVERMPAVPAPAPAALQPVGQPEPAARLAEPAEPVNRSFTGGG